MHERKQASQPEGILHTLLSIIVLVALVLGLTWGLRTFIFQAYEIPSGSMETTIMPGDMVLSEKITYYGRPPAAGDIVTFEDPDPEHMGRILIKRVIAVGGQTVEIDYSTSTVYVDGVPLDAYSRDGLRRRLALVLQDTWLFGGTIAENIAYGAPGASREQIVEAAKAARIHRFVSSLPQGYDTVLTCEGISKGQKQLLAIARCLLTDADVVILDEATSNVDTETEGEISLAMERLRQGRTCFVIAHRLATIRGADRILVLDQGGAAEQGTHQELLAAGGVYAQLYAAQFQT